MSARLLPLKPCSLQVSARRQWCPADERSILQGAVVIPDCAAEPQESSQRITRCFSSLSAKRPGEAIWKVSEHMGHACSALFL